MTWTVSGNDMLNHIKILFRNTFMLQWLGCRGIKLSFIIYSLSMWHHSLNLIHKHTNHNIQITTELNQQLWVTLSKHSIQSTYLCAALVIFLFSYPTYRISFFSFLVHCLVTPGHWFPLGEFHPWRLITFRHGLQHRWLCGWRRGWWGCHIFPRPFVLTWSVWNFDGARSWKSHNVAHWFIKTSSVGGNISNASYVIYIYF